MVAETSLNPADLVMPYFVIEGKNQREVVPSMPGIYRYSVDSLIKEIAMAKSCGIRAIALFPATPIEKKSEFAEESYNGDNLICKAVREVKQKFPNMGIICDVALDPYTSHGHDGVVRNGYVQNDETVDILCKQALTQAKAGCDIIAPSDMMDGRIGKIRAALDENGFQHVVILSYGVKYASSLYSPFRDAVGSSGNLAGANKKTYQMDFCNKAEALREAAQDISEGADIIMVKPAGFYLDIIAKLQESFPVPIAAYQVSGEYAMIKHLAEKSFAYEQNLFYESLIAIKRAGASIIFTYYAIEITKLLSK